MSTAIRGHKTAPVDRPRTTAAAEAKPTLVARLLGEIKRLLLIITIGGLVLIALKYYGFDRLDEEIRRHFESLLRSHYTGLAVHVKSARRIPDRGVEFRGIVVSEVGSKNPAILAEIDEVFVECDTRLPDFVTKPLQITSVRVKRLKLRAERKPSGTWNLSYLFPLPNFGGSTPPATISDASLEIVDPASNPTGSLTLRNMELSVTPRWPSDGKVTPKSVAAATAPELPAKVSDDGSPVPSKPTDDDTKPLLLVRGSMTGDYLEKIEIEGLVSPSKGSWDLRGAVEGLEFSPRLRGALPQDVSHLLEPLSSVRGRTYFGFHAQRGERTESGEMPPVQFVVHGKISDGRIDDTRLPDPLTDVEATIRADNRGVLISDLSARCGPTVLAGDAELQGYSLESPMHLELTANQVALDRINVEILPPSLRSIWNRFLPRGGIDIAAKLDYDGCTWKPDVTVRCHDLSIQYDKFPYRIQEGTGTITWKNDKLDVRLRSVGGGQVVRCRADIMKPGPDFTGWIDIVTEGPIPIDEKLFAAVDSKTHRLLRSFSPRGSASVQAHFIRNPGDPVVHRTAQIDLHEVSIQYDKFRYPIDKITGSLQMTDGDWVFHNLSGRNDSGYIVGQGTWLANPEDGNELTLQFTGTDLQLEDELRLALPPGAQRLWTNLHPRGNIDHLVVRLKYGLRTRAVSLEVEAQKWPPGQNLEGRSISIEPAWLPYRLDNLTGLFHYRDGNVRLQNLRADHGRTQVAAEGSCRILEDGSATVELSRLSADRISLDHEFLKALPDSVRQGLTQISLAGPLCMEGNVGVIVSPLVEVPPEINWDLTFDLENGSLVIKQPIEHVHGEVRLWGQTGINGLACRGELNIDSAMVKTVQLTRIQGPLWLDSQQLLIGSWAERDVQGRLPRQLTASVVGGVMALDAQVSLDSEAAFRIHTTLENAELPAIMKEVAPRHQGLSGRVFSVVDLTGTALGSHTHRGTGQIRLRDADIYQLPVMIAMLKLLSIQQPNRTAFTQSNIDFRIEGDDLELDRIDFNGDTISLKGRGHITAQKTVDLQFYTQVGRDELQVPIFRPILGEASRQFMLIEVTGTLEDPIVNKQAFPRLNERLQQLFPELAREMQTVEPPAPTSPTTLLPWRR